MIKLNFKKNRSHNFTLNKEINAGIILLGKAIIFELNMSEIFHFYALNLSFKHYPGSRNCAAQQRVLHIILNLADKTSKRNLII